MSSAATFRAKLAALEAEDAARAGRAEDRVPLPSTDTSAAYIKQADGYQYERDYAAYQYDNRNSYGVAEPPKPPPPVPADSARVLFGSPEAMDEAVSAMRTRLLPLAEKAALEAQWDAVRRNLTRAHAAVLTALERCNVQSDSCFPQDIAAPDEIRMLIFTEPPTPWMSATDDAEAYAAKVASLKGFGELQALRYAVAVQTSMQEAVRRMVAHVRKLEADEAEATGAASLIRQVERLIDNAERRVESSRADETFIVQQQRVSEAEERRLTKGQTGAARLQTPPPTIAEKREQNRTTEVVRGDAGAVVVVTRGSGGGAPSVSLVADVPGERLVKDLRRRADAALNPARPWQDLGACQRAWSLLREAVEECVAHISEADATRNERRRQAEARYDTVRQHIATLDVDTIVASAAPSRPGSTASRRTYPALESLKSSPARSPAGAELRK
jgi:hypothetical protein